MASICSTATEDTARRGVPTFPEPIPWVSRRYSALLNRDGSANYPDGSAELENACGNGTCSRKVCRDAPQRA
jgi:hypothetical protein